MDEATNDEKRAAWKDFIAKRTRWDWHQRPVAILPIPYNPFRKSISAFAAEDPTSPARDPARPSISRRRRAVSRRRRDAFHNPLCRPGVPPPGGDGL